MRIKTQADLAKLLNVEQTTVSVWEIDRGTPKTETMRKLFELGATVEELFGIEYNKMHNLGVLEASRASSGETPKKLSEFEADLLREILDEYAIFDGELESIKKWKEVYKLEREIERGDNTTDLTAKKQRLKELQEQIENEIPWLDRFNARRLIKSLEDDLEQMEDMDRHNSYEKPDRRRRILDLQEQIEKEMYSYVEKELKKLYEQESTNKKVRRFWLKNELRKLQEQIKRTDSTPEQNLIILRMDDLENKLASLEEEG